MFQTVNGPMTIINMLSALIPLGPSGDDLQMVFKNEERLYNDLFKNYSGGMPKTLPVRCIPFLSIDHIFTLDETHQTVMLHGSILLAWLDERLMWNISEYGNVRELSRPKSIFFQKKMWVPSIHLSDLFTRTDNLLAMADSSDISIAHSGLVRVQVKVQLKTTCLFKFGEYPNDYHNCSFSLYTPYDASEFVFSEFGGVEMIKYSIANAVNSPKVDFQDYKLVTVDSGGFYLIAGATVTKLMKQTNARLARSFFRYNMVFKRVNLLYQSRQAIPMICATIFVGMAGMAPGFAGLIWLLVCMLYQVLNMSELLETLPPDYQEMPLIGQMGVFLITETLFLIIWRLFTIYARRNNNAENKLKMKSKDVDAMETTLVYEIVTIGDGIIVVLLIVQIIMNTIVLI